MPIVFILITLTSCKSCLGDLYSAHEKPVALKIVFEMPEKQILQLTKHIDSSNILLKQKLSTYPINTMKIGSQDRIVCLDNSCTKCYLLEIDKNKVTIKCLFDTTISKEWWVCSVNQLENKKINQIENDFKKQVLEKVRNLSH